MSELTTKAVNVAESSASLKTVEMSEKYKSLAEKADANKDGVLTGEEIKVFVGLVKDFQNVDSITKQIQQTQSQITAEQSFATMSNQNESTIDEILAKPLNEISEADIAKIMEESENTKVKWKKMESRDTDVVGCLFKKALYKYSGGGAVIGATWGTYVAGLPGCITGTVSGAVVGLAVTFLGGLFTNEIIYNSKGTKNLKNKYNELQKKLEDIKNFKMIINAQSKTAGVKNANNAAADAAAAVYLFNTLPSMIHNIGK